MNKEKLEEIRDLLIVVDMVNGFIREGAMSDSYIEHIIPRIEKLVNEYTKETDKVIFIKDCHEKDAVEFNRYPVHCLKNTSESELVDELKKYENNALVYEKNSTSAITAPGFIDDIKKMNNLERVVITGCCTDICDINLAIPLQNIFDQENRSVDIYVPMDAVETYNSPEHNRDEWNDMAMKFMKQGGIKLVKTYERK